MTTLSLRLPESLHRHLTAVAKRKGVSVNQLINSAVAEDYLMKRAKRASRKKFGDALAKVADIEPDDVDRIGQKRKAR